MAYIRPPETTLGSKQRGPPVDSWATALVALAIWTGQVPTLCHEIDIGDDHRKVFALQEAFRLLPRLTDDIWPGHTDSPIGPMSSAGSIQGARQMVC